MKEFDPIEDVENSALILDQGKWPNFHDADVHNLSIWRGDMRPDDNVWIGPAIEVRFELCALEKPYIAVLKFHDCNSIRMEEFSHQNTVYDLSLTYVARGINTTNGKPLPPHISVSFEQAFNAALRFTCFRVQAIERREIENDIVILP